LSSFFKLNLVNSRIEALQNDGKSVSMYRHFKSDNAEVPLITQYFEITIIASWRFAGCWCY